MLDQILQHLDQSIRASLVEAAQQTPEGVDQRGLGFIIFATATAIALKLGVSSDELMRVLPEALRQGQPQPKIVLS